MRIRARANSALGPMPTIENSVLTVKPYEINKSLINDAVGN